MEKMAVSCFAAVCEVIRMNRHQLVIIGGGPAGMAAAVAASEAGVADILIIEREKKLGGILKQCIHNGFGLHLLRRDLTGPEYADHFRSRVAAAEIQVMTDAMVLTLDENKNLTVSSALGINTISADAVILAMGCRERPAGAVMLPGTRPAGIYTAGVAQNFVNLQNKMVGKRVVIRGSGDIGLIMARRLTLEGAEVVCVVERKEYSSGLPRNLVQCLDDFNIPIKYRHIVSAVHGKERVEAVTLSMVDQYGRPLPGTDRVVPCDTLILSLGLIPENELSLQAGISLDRQTGGAFVDAGLQTSVPGIFACGNVLHVHDLVDNVSEEAAQAGKSAAAYLAGATSLETLPILPGNEVKYVLPQQIIPGKAVRVSLRVQAPGRNRKIRISCGNESKVYSLPRINPAEMQRLMVPAELTQGKKLPVEVVVE